MLQEARIKIVARAIYTYLFFLIHRFSSSAEKQKLVVIVVFFSKLDHRQLFNGRYYDTFLGHYSMVYILGYYSSVKILFNMINKHQTLPIVYTQGWTFFFLGAQLFVRSVSLHSFFDTNNSIRTKALILIKKLRTS